MKSPDQFPEIFLYRHFVDMRKQINGLAAIVEQEMKLSPFSEALFVFTGKNRKLIRAVYWDKTGFAMWSKRLEKARYFWPRSGEQVISLTATNFSWLLDGMDLSKIKIHETLKPTAFL